MSDSIQTVFETLPEPKSIEDLGKLIDCIQNVLGVEHVSYLAVSLGHAARFASSEIGVLSNDVGAWWRQDSSLGASTYNPEWGARYIEQDYHKIDPVVAGAARSFIPLNWKNLDWADKQRRQILREAIDFGIGNQGYTVPIHGPDGQFAIFVINSTCSDDEWERIVGSQRSAILVISHFFHQKVLEITKVFGEQPAVKLSARETDVLTSLALGKNRSQAAYDLKISENTLRVYVDSARHKLGALNLPHAIAIGLKKGLINI